MTVYTPTPMERALGWVFGVDSTVRLPPGPHPPPRTVLDDLLLSAWQHPPVLVAFSGGVDSSAVLAAAADVARREGLDLPVPVTRVHPSALGTEEGQWQELVMSHLGLGDWTRLTFGDELDLIGPIAAQVLHRHGVVWPAAAHTALPMLDAAQGGTLITGEGGDEIFGPRRLTPLDGMVRRRVRPTAALIRAGVGQLAPRQVVAERSRRDWQPPAWLTPAAAAEGRRRTALDTEPRRMHAALEWLVARRTWQEGRRTRTALAEERGVHLLDPLLEPAFVAAVADHWTPADVGSRARALARLIPGLLPDAVRRRHDKAYFNHALFAGPSARFARSWDGKALDAELVDARRLRAAWLRREPPAQAALLLQRAWLAATP